MNIHKLLLRLYPRVWRTRYEEEFLVVLASHPFSFGEGADVIRGAIDAHLHPRLGTTDLSLSEKMRQMLLTLRCSLLTVFCTCVAFLMAGQGLQEMAESGDFQEATKVYSVIGLSSNLVVIGAVVTLTAMLIGGLPILIAVIRSALARKQHASLILLGVPILAFAIFLGMTFLLEAIIHPGGSHPSPLWQLYLDRGLFFGTQIAAVIASTGSLCLAVTRSDITEARLRSVLPLCVLVTLSMVLMLGATIVWGLGLYANIPQLFTGNHGIVRSSTTGTWLGIIIIMAFMTMLALISLIRGREAATALRASSV